MTPKGIAPRSARGHRASPGGGGRPDLAASRLGDLWAADERGVHRSDDGGVRFERVAVFEPRPRHVRGLALVRNAT